MRLLAFPDDAPRGENMRRLALGLIAALALLTLTSCRAGGPLLGAVYTSGPALRVLGDGASQPAVVHYSLGRPAAVSVWLDDARGERLVLRERQPRPPGADYQLSFDGTY